MERLQKILAQAGIASRRRAEEMILAGQVRVNGQVVNVLGAQVDPANDKILVDNQPVIIESKAYFLLNKPRGYISDRDDTAEYKTALDLVPGNFRLFAAGRLDMNSEGLLFLTNDGELANRLTHPRYEHEKEYLALVFGTPDGKTLERLVRGILYEGEWLRADSAELAGRHQIFGESGRDETWLRIILHEGKKRQIRHMCAALGHPVKRLIRVRIGPLLLGNLKVGEWRKLTGDEIAQLRTRAELRGSKPKGKSKTPRAAKPKTEPGAPEAQSDKPKSGQQDHRPKSPAARVPDRASRVSSTGTDRTKSDWGKPVGAGRTASGAKPKPGGEYRGAKSDWRKPGGAGRTASGAKSKPGGEYRGAKSDWGKPGGASRTASGAKPKPGGEYRGAKSDWRKPGGENRTAPNAAPKPSGAYRQAKSDRWDMRSTFRKAKSEGRGKPAEPRTPAGDNRNTPVAKRPSSAPPRKSEGGSGKSNTTRSKKRP